MSILTTERHTITVKIVFAIILVSALAEGQILQKITFYTSSEKGLPSQSFTREENINAQSLAYNAGSFCVEEGLWVLTIRTGDYEFKEWIGGSVGGEICHNQLPSGRNYVAVRPVGETDLENSVLTLFPDVKWEAEETRIEDDEDESSENMLFRSYVLTGTESYEIFPESNFGGIRICLVANVSPGPYLNYGIRGDFNTTIDYRSSRRGCSTGGGEEGGNQTTTERGGSGSVSQFSWSISNFFHFVNLVVLYYSRKIIF